MSPFAYDYPVNILTPSLLRIHSNFLSKLFHDFVCMGRVQYSSEYIWIHSEFLW